MIGGKKQLTAVIDESILGIDRRYDGYHPDLTKALIDIISVQEDTATDAARRDQIQRIVESLGSKVAATDED